MNNIKTTGKKLKGFWGRKNECEVPVKIMGEDTYHLLLEQLDGIFFEMDFIKKEFLLSPKYYDKFGVLLEEKSCFEGDIKNLNLHPEDEGIWSIIKSQIDQNVPIITEKLRVRNNKGEYIWCQVVMKCIYEKECLTFITGKIVNIQCEPK